ncbi:MAG: hypothetical protein ACYSU7_19155, partial [Planctomycetota bacterium]
PLEAKEDPQTFGDRDERLTVGDRPANRCVGPRFAWSLAGDGEPAGTILNPIFNGLGLELLAEGEPPLGGRGTSVGIRK